MSLRLLWRVGIVGALGIAAISPSLAGNDAASAGKSAYEAAYRHAQSVAKKADDMHATWTVTKPELEKAGKAAEAGRYDEAKRLADHAAALAQASIEQAEQQKTAWKAAVVR
jgi:hypothetical protein